MKQQAIPVLQSALRVVDAVASGHAQGSVRKIAAELGIAPATCFRILTTLEQAQWISTDPGGNRQVRPELLARLAGRSDRETLLQRSKPLLEQLAEQTGLAAKLSIRDGLEAVTVFRAESPRGMALSGRTGARFPLAFGSSGAVLCAGENEQELLAIAKAAPREAWKYQSPAHFLARVQQAAVDGWCRDAGSFHPQVHTISVPVGVGTARGAITLMSLPADMPPRSVPGLVRRLRTAAGEIEGQRGLLPLAPERSA